MQVFWLEQRQTDVPPQNDWLTASERFRLDAMRLPKRHFDWRLGRWTAKLAVAEFFSWRADFSSLAKIEIRSAASGAPVVFVGNEPARLEISISHRADSAMCALGEAGVPLGCDLERVEPHSDAFVSDYFTAGEQSLLAALPPDQRTCFIALVWSAKESTLKALQEGLRLDTRSVSVLDVDPGHDFGSGQSSGCWHPFQTVYSNSKRFCAWWQRSGELVSTIVTSARSGIPVRLLSGHHDAEGWRISAAMPGRT